MNIKKLSFLVIVSLLFSCSNQKGNTVITIKNALNFERAFETVELTKSDLNVENLANIGIRNTETNTMEVIQIVDNDGDRDWDVILFQPNIKANSEANFEVVIVTEAEKPKTC